jgi:hypothetical protein
MLPQGTWWLETAAAMQRQAWERGESGHEQRAGAPRAQSPKTTAQTIPPALARDLLPCFCLVWGPVQVPPAVATARWA